MINLIFRFENSLYLWIIDKTDNFYRKIVSHKTYLIPCNDTCIVNLRSFFSRMILTQALTQQFVCQIARYIFHFNQASKTLIAAFSLIYSMTSIKVVYIWCDSKCTTEEVHKIKKKKSQLLQGNMRRDRNLFLQTTSRKICTKSWTVDIAIL